MDHTIRDAKTATAALSAPVLSSIPASTRARREEIAKPGTPRRGGLPRARGDSVATDRLPRSIVVTSPLGDMQDTVAANFAAALAGLGVRVALDRHLAAPGMVHGGFDRPERRRDQRRP